MSFTNPILRPVGLASLLILVSACTTVSQNRPLHIDYTVEVRDPETKLFHVTASVENIDQPSLELSLPTWTPGWYVTANYAKNIQRLKITDAKGALIPHTMTRKQTWSVDTRAQRAIQVEFDYRADQFAINQAHIYKEFAFFTGTQLFLMAEGHRASPSTVRFIVPAGWKIVSALTETSDPLTFTAPDYDTLVDAPTEMGHFDLTRFEVEGKAHYFVATPAGGFSAQKTKEFTGMLTKIATTQSAIFGGLPYDKYVYFYFFWPPGATQQALLEHANSQFLILPPAKMAEADERMSWKAAHEFFHLWNVKRIRPVELWPYDYSHEIETPLLWVSEGFSEYYALVSTYRAGLRSRQTFLDQVADNIQNVEKNEARTYFSPAASSVAIWVNYGSGGMFRTDVYAQGQNLGALLDLSIRHDTAGQASLDDVMRGLYRDFYERGKGFSTEDMIGIINRLTHRDYHDFYRRYVSGVEVPPYDTIFGYAGYRVEETTRKTRMLGFGSGWAGGRLSVSNVEPASTAAAAGLQVGDVISQINGQDPDNESVWAKLRSNEIIGQSIKLTVKRAGEDREILFKVGSRDQEVYNLTELSQPTADQLKIREGWLNVGNQK